MVKLVFTDQYANFLLLLNGIAILFYIAAKKKKKQRAMKFGNYKTLQKVAGKNFLKSSNIMLVIKILAVTSLVIGISNPVIVEELPSTRTDYVIAIDNSGSMLADDIQPTRLDAAKQISKGFVGKLSSDVKVGVVSFSGEVRQQSGLTNDREKVREAIDSTDTGRKAGTAIGDAIYSGSSMLIDSNRSKTLILVTDGRNNVGSSLNESIEYAVSHNVKVNTIGIGEERGSEGDQFDTVDGVNATRAEFPNLNTARLNRTAEQTGGKMVVATNRSSLESAFLSFEESEKRTDISIYFIFIALGLMLLEWMLGTTRYSILP